MKKDDCIFCKIANGEIPSHTLYEDDIFRVILDLGPATKGHALIIPKNHYDNLWELGDAEAAGVIPLAKKIAAAMLEELHCDGLNLIQNNNQIAGQTIFHFHTHIVPRYKNDGNKFSFVTHEADENLLKEIAEKINSRLQVR